MDPDPGGLKPCGSCGSGSPTLIIGDGSSFPISESAAAGTSVTNQVERGRRRGQYSHVQEELEGAEEEGGGVLEPNYDTYFSLKKRTEMTAASYVQQKEGEEGCVGTGDDTGMFRRSLKERGGRRSFGAGSTASILV